jgi:RAD51-like protein 3
MTALDRLQHALAFDIDTAYAVLDALHNALDVDILEKEVPRVRLIVIDSITSLLGPSLSATPAEGKSSSFNIYMTFRD